MTEDDFDFDPDELEVVSLEDLETAAKKDKDIIDPADLVADNDVSTDTLQSFLRDVGKFDLLSAEEEVLLAEKIAEGDKKAKDKMIQSNLRLVIAIAKFYRNQGVSFLDLIQDGTLGLIRAAEKYDPDKGYRFSTYATWWIRQGISRGIADKSRTIRIPVHIVEKLNKIVKTQRDLYSSLGREATNNELSEVLGIPPEEIDRIIQASRVPSSLDRPISEDSEDDNEFGAFLVDSDQLTPEEMVMETLQNETLDQILDSLTFRERQILEMRYGLNGRPVRTLDEVGRSFNITKERVRQIETASLEKLRKMPTAQFLRRA